MHRAVENSRLATVTELLRHGADIDRPNKGGNTPLHLACAIGHVSLVRALLQAGAVAMSFNLKGYCPLHTAIHCGQRKVLEALISFHKNRRLAWETLLVEKTNDNPLHVAVRALRDIAADEEVTISYIDAMQDYDVRRKTLKEHYGFDCTCGRCSLEQKAMLKKNMETKRQYLAGQRR